MTDATTPSIAACRPRSLAGILVAQFLGAFNDNLFKQLCLLLALSGGAGGDAQGLATVIFAAPFILFSSLAGYWADRYSKRTIFRLCKWAEVVIMGMGLVVFWVGTTGSTLLFQTALIVLFFAGLHSTIFGPAKYGILPELLPEADLPAANGWMQMTTFIAIILGASAAGLFKSKFADALWIGSAASVVLAVVGVIASYLIQPVHPGRPEQHFQWDDLFLNRRTRQTLRDQPRLLHVLLLSSLFFLVAGITQQAVNSFGIKQLFADDPAQDQKTSYLVACLSIGIALGSASAAKLSAGRVNFRLVQAGAGGLVVTLMTFTLPIIHSPLGAAGLLVLIGTFAGWYAIPLQSYLQAHAPADRKGRIIGAMNLLNWIGILTSGVIYHVLTVIRHQLGLPPAAVFGITGLLLAPILLLPIGRWGQTCDPPPIHHTDERSP